MSDLNDFTKPDTSSQYGTEIWQTVRGHITKLWMGDYTGIANAATGMRRWVVSGSDIQLKQRNAGGTEDVIFDTSDKISKTATADQPIGSNLVFGSGKRPIWGTYQNGLFSAPAGVDLNGLTITNNYLIPASRSNDPPTSGSVFAVVECSFYDANYGTQRYYEYFGGSSSQRNVWVRHRDSGIWTVWVAQANFGDAVAAVGGKSIAMPANTNIESYFTTAVFGVLPSSGFFDCYLTVAQGTLPAGYWYLQNQRYSSDAVGNHYKTVFARSFEGSFGNIGAVYYNTCANGIWGGWKPVVGNVGAIKAFASASAPSGWLALPLSPTNVSRTTYAALFGVIGTTWGSGDGSTTFGIPYLAAGAVPVMSSSNVGSETDGVVLAHTHTTTYQYNGSGGSGGAGTAGGIGSTVTAGQSPAGGAKNLAAGSRMLWCVQY